jgi:hypothetical protein
MRDSDLAIGGLVLLGIVGALVYFLFPKFITGVLRGPSYAAIIKNQQNEIAAFNRETEIVVSYLHDSWTMKAYRNLEAVIGRDGYRDWVQKIQTERTEIARDTMAYVGQEIPPLERLTQSLESKLSVRDKTKRSFFDLAKSPLDAEIEALQTDLDRKTSELSQFLNHFSEKRRVLNQKALTEWFKRSLLVGLLTAGIVIVVCAVSVSARNSSSAKLSASKKSPVMTSLGFVATAPRQVGLIKPVESPVLADAAFHFSFQPKTGPIPDSISSVLAELPKTNTALKLASILGGYPETPASRSHHLNESGGLIVHTAKVLKHSKPLLPTLPDPRIGPLVILAHDIGKILTLSNDREGQPHDIPSADIVASLPELREDFDEMTAQSMILAIRHQHSKAEIPLNAPPLTETILQFIKKADLSASAEESREAAEKMRELVPKVLELFPYIVPELNVNGCMGGKAEGYLCDGYLYLLKESVKEKLLRNLKIQNAPVFKGQDPVWNEMALALAGAGLITTKAGAKEAGKKSCLFTIKSPQGQEKTIAIPVASLAPHLTNRWLQSNIPKIEVL